MAQETEADSRTASQQQKPLSVVPPQSNAQPTAVLSPRKVTIDPQKPIYFESSNSSGSSVHELMYADGDRDRSRSPPPAAARRRLRTMSSSSRNEHLITKSGKKIYTKGRPPWYSKDGKIKEPYLIGVCGGSASGKTTVAAKIVEKLEVPWITLLSMDSFYKVLNKEQHEQAEASNYNFDHPDAFDFDLLLETLTRLREGKNVEIPSYNFSTHSRDPNPRIVYGADVLIFEGILAFYRADIVFVDTDDDTRLARRLVRDITERGREVKGVLDQYVRFVKPAFDNFIKPGMHEADVIVPRGGENTVAIDLICKRVSAQLIKRGYDSRRRGTEAEERNDVYGGALPNTLTLVEQTPQVRGMHTFIRNEKTKRDEIIFYSERLMRILVEEAMNFVPFNTVDIEVSGKTEKGTRQAAEICGVAIMRAGETMESALKSVVKDCKMGRILIQTNELTHEPALYFLRLPKDIHKYRVFLMDATVATGAAAMMAIHILLDHDVLEENIVVVSLLMARQGVTSIAYSFPKVQMVTTAVDDDLDENSYVLPGCGNFGDRYYGTGLSDDENEEPL